MLHQVETKAADNPEAGDDTLRVLGRVIEGGTSRVHEWRRTILGT